MNANETRQIRLSRRSVIFVTTLALLVAIYFAVNTESNNRDPEPADKGVLPEANDNPESQREIEAMQSNVPASSTGMPSTLPPLVVVVDDQIRSTLEPWFNEFRSTQRVYDPIEVYEFVSFDDDLLLEIKNGNRSNLIFQIDNDHTYELHVDSIFKFDGGWIMNAYIAERPDMSEARIFVHDDGTKGGEVFVMGLGRWLIEPSQQLPYHAVYLRTGSLNID